MLAKDKLYIVSSIVDDTIKTQATVYDLTIFRRFVDLEKYVELTPIIIDTLLITCEELPCTSTNMLRLSNMVSSPFVQITSNVIYLIDGQYDVKTVSSYFERSAIEKFGVYQGELNLKFVMDIITGKARRAVEEQAFKVTYRIKRSEYIKSQQLLGYDTIDEHYSADEERLQGIPDEEEPIQVPPSVDELGNIMYLVGEDSYERTLFSFLIAQYFSITDKTLIVEKDVQYHTLTELVTKSRIDCELITVDEVYDNITSACKRIISTKKKLVVIAARNRVNYDYEFLFETLYSSLGENVPYFVKECDFRETPYGMSYTVVIPNTIPDILRCCNKLIFDVDVSKCLFIGLQLNNLSEVCVTTSELCSIISQVISKTSVNGEVLKADGILLKGDRATYDIFGVIKGITFG